MALLWFTSIPLGIPGEWTWERPSVEPDLLWNLGGGAVAAGLLIAFIRMGWRRFEHFSGKGSQGFEIAAWLIALVCVSFTWLWIVQEVAPGQNRLGKSAFVLYYASSSGYFTRVRYEEPDMSKFLAGYEDLMREGDVLHTGTHPPGLFLAFYGLIAVCESSPTLCAVLDATQPLSFREATDIIAANAMKRRIIRPFHLKERRVLWLATLLVMLSAALSVIPLYGLLRQTCTIPTSWMFAALFPALPGVAVFIPKSDVLFAVFGLTMMWLWLTAWNRRSIIVAVLAGLVAWLGLLCSLAFLPILLATALMSLGADWFFPGIPIASADSPGPTTRESAIGWRRWLCVVAAGLGFLAPTIVIWRRTDTNLVNVWWMNYQNHARFYQQFDRTYWKWLLVNPLETSYAAGWPVFLLALSGCCFWLVKRDLPNAVARSRIVVVCSLASVWGLLWLTGKNSGEAARLWILFLPWLVWIAGIYWDTGGFWTGSVSSDRRWRSAPMLIFLVAQFLISILTVARVSGFHSDSGNAG